VAGWCSSWLVGLSGTPDSWTAPCQARRSIVGENLNTMAVQQIRSFLPRLGPTGVAALFAFDGGYDPVQLSVGLHGVNAQIVVRIKSDRKFFTRPAPRRPGTSGRPRVHGDRLSCNDPHTWHTPDATSTCQDGTYGRVEVKAWQALHPASTHLPRARRAMTIVEGTIIRVQVSRLPARRGRQPKTLWLWWHGPAPDDLDLDRVWRAYIRRFDIEHTIRFAKQLPGPLGAPRMRENRYTVVRRRRRFLAQVRPSNSLMLGAALRGCALWLRARGSDSSRFPAGSRG
jgi:hypothetical protein